MRLNEIEKRMAEIKVELDSPEANIDALEKEVSSLKEERQGILDQAEKRKKLREDVANDKVPTNTIEVPKEERKMEFTQDNVLLSKEYRSAFLKNLQGKELDEVEKRALTTAANSAGGAVPTTTMNLIIDKLVQTSALFNEISVTQLAGNVSFVVANAKNDAAWKTEGADGTPADDTVVTVNLTGFELIKLVEVSAAANAMTLDAFETYITEEISRKMAIAIENAILNGTGSGQPKGILAETFTPVQYTKLGMVYKDLMKIIAALPTMYHQNAKFTMPRKLFFEEVLGMVDTTGNPVVTQDPQAPGKFNIIGYPVIINDYVPTDTILFGNFKYYRFNFSLPISIASDPSVGFKSGKMTYRGLAVADGKTALLEAFVKGTRSAT